MHGVTTDHDARSNIMSLMDDTVVMDSTFITTTSRREALTSKLMLAAEGIDLSPEAVRDMKPMALESKLSVIRTASDLLSAQEKATLDKVKVKLKMDQNNEDKNMAEMVNSFLKTISASIGKDVQEYDEEDVQEKIDALAERADVTVKETELRTDPTDVS